MKRRKLQCFSSWKGSVTRYSWSIPYYHHKCLSKRYFLTQWVHYSELNNEAKEEFGQPPEGYFHYWASKFPRLLVYTWNVMKTSKDHPTIKHYYTRAWTSEDTKTRSCRGDGWPVTVLKPLIDSVTMVPSPCNCRSPFRWFVRPHQINCLASERSRMSTWWPVPNLIILGRVSSV